MISLFLLRRLNLFFNLRCLADSVAEVVKLCSSNLTNTNDINLSYVRGMEGECLFNTTTIGNTSYSKCLGDSAAVLSNNGTLEHLNSLFVSFLDLVVNTYSITDSDHRNLCLNLLTCKSLNQIHFSVLLKYRAFMQSCAADHP